MTQANRDFVMSICKQVLKAGLSLDRSLGVLHLYLDQAAPGEEFKGEDMSFARGYIRKSFTLKAKLLAAAKDKAAGIEMQDHKVIRVPKRVPENPVATQIVRGYIVGESWDSIKNRVRIMLPGRFIDKKALLEAISHLVTQDADVTELVQIVEEEYV
jgi:hypothetical protein